MGLDLGDENWIELLSQRTYWMGDWHGLETNMGFD